MQLIEFRMIRIYKCQYSHAKGIGICAANERYRLWCEKMSRDKGVLKKFKLAKYCKK